MEIRNSKIEDIDAIMGIYVKAREIMRSSGNPNQWGNTHPPREVIVNDIKNNHSYVVIENGIICASFFFDIMDDPTYSVIENGEWLNDEQYGVIHRIGSSGEFKGVLEAVIDYCFQKINNIRIDTHEDNKIMQHLLSKYGFTRCGIIHLLNGDPRIAYHKCIK